MTPPVSRKHAAPPWSPDGRILRLCLDLNVWVSAQLANVEKHRNTAAQTLVQVAELGRCALGPTQIVISWGMLTRLRSVFERKLQTGRTDIDVEIQQIATLASLGPAENAPYLLLGGTGVMPLKDDEDAHVLDTAVAGDAHVLATANFDDFIWYRSEIVKPGRIAIHEGPRKPLVIAHPFEVVRWTREGRITFD